MERVICLIILKALLVAVASASLEEAAPKLLEGVPIYNYDEDFGSMQAVYTSKFWILNFPADTTNTAIGAFCQDPPGNSECSAKGNPAEQGLAFVEFHGTEKELREVLQRHPDIKPMFIEPDAEVSAFPDLEENVGSLDAIETSSVASWGLDRVDAIQGLDGSYSAPKGSKEGAGAHVYVADTGIRTTHQDFGGRAIPAIDCTSGTCKECKGDATCAFDGHGHGTHCAGTVGGTTYGVAKKTTLHAVKVLSDSGSGYMSGILKSIDWVASKGLKPAVWSASLGGSGRRPSYEVAFQKAINSGVLISVAAGNSNDNACNYSPAFAPSAITVGATDNTDKRAGFSNYGTCLDIFAPGVSIKSASGKSDTGSQTFSGTSMACPHVSGVLALLLADNPSLDVVSAQSHMLHIAGKNFVKDAKVGSPNLMLYTGTESGGVSTYTTSTYTTTTSTTITTTPKPLTPGSGFCSFESSAEPFCGIWHQGKQDDFDWTRRSGSTPSRNTGPNSAHAGSFYVYTEVSSPIGSGDEAILEALTPTLKSGAFLSFFYHMKGASTMGSLKVQVRSTTTGSTQELWSESGHQGDQWRSKTIDLDSFSGESLRISFVGNKAGGIWQGDVAIDDVMLSIETQNGTTTTAPGDTTTNSATKTMTSTSSSTSTSAATTSTTTATTTTTGSSTTTSITGTTSTSTTTRKVSTTVTTTISSATITTTTITTTSSSTSSSTSAATTSTTATTNTPGSSTTKSITGTTSTSTTTTSTQTPDDKSIQSGDTVFLRTLSGLGSMLDIEGSAVQSRWVAHGNWQAISVEKENGGSISSGDAVFLKTQTGAYIDVSGEMVQARWAERGEWQKLIIEKHGGDGLILPSDLVCFRAHTGKHVDVQGAVVQARWNDCGDWQTMQIEREVAGAVFSGSAIHLLAHTGKRVEVEGTAVQARWAEAATWQTFQITNYGGRAIFSGDVVFLKAHTGLMVDVESTEVQARWNDWGAWQQLRIQKKNGSGAVRPGDSILLQTHRGKFIDVQGIAVQARFSDKGDWQTLVVETMASRRLSDGPVTSRGLVELGVLSVQMLLMVTMALIPLMAMMMWRHSKRVSYKVQAVDDGADFATV